jgi:sulfur-oxidizing protein SoxZ
MVIAQPRVQAPATAAKGDIIQVMAIISHPMETGLRRDGSGRIMPRDIIHSFTCRYDGEVVFSVDLHEAMSANPFLEFAMRATHSGRFQFIWQEDGGATYTLEKPLTVTG